MAFQPRLVAFDWGHTLMDERKNVSGSGTVHLMPDVLEVLPLVGVPMAVWANTRTAREADVRTWLARAGIEDFFESVVTSVDAGARKPAAAFFEFALSRSRVAKHDVLFVGNQLNTDIAGGEAFGIRTVWVCGDAYRSEDDDAGALVKPSYTIQRLSELLVLLKQSGVTSTIV